MIGLSAEIGVHQLWALGAKGVVTRRFEGDEDGVDFVKDFRIAVFEDPPPLGLVVREKDSEALGLLLLSFFDTPDPIAAALFNLGLVQVVGVEDKRFAVGDEDAAERRLH